MSERLFIIHDGPRLEEQCTTCLAFVEAVFGVTPIPDAPVVLDTEKVFDQTFGNRTAGLQGSDAELQMQCDEDCCGDPECPRQELLNLRQWKAEAMVVLSRIDLQELGELLDLNVGDDILPAVIPRIKLLEALTEAQSESVLKLSQQLQLMRPVVELARLLLGPNPTTNYTEVEKWFDEALARLDAATPVLTKAAK
jgi:hypothetical protein